jgi:hypothetical protein
MSTLEGIHGYMFAPANFPDADEERPSENLDVLGNGDPTPYTTGINSMLNSHISEIKEKISSGMTVPGGWKKHLREFMKQKNTDLLSFLNITLNSHPFLGTGQQLLRKFGAIPIRGANLREIVLDASGTDVIADISGMLLSMQRGDGIQDFLETVKLLYTEYRQAGDRALISESSLRGKLEILDKVQSRLSSILELEPSETYDTLIAAIEDFITAVFEKNKIADSYQSFIEAYRRFIALRDIVSMTRASQEIENEPMCMICLDEGVSYALSPCGHTYCSSCIRKQLAACFICRGVIRDRVKLYFG